MTTQFEVTVVRKYSVAAGDAAEAERIVSLQPEIFDFQQTTKALPASALETSVTRCSHGVPIDPAIPCEKCGSSPMTTCARCGATVNIRGVRSDGWIDVEPHNCPTANR